MIAHVTECRCTSFKVLEIAVVLTPDLRMSSTDCLQMVPPTPNAKTVGLTSNPLSSRVQHLQRWLTSGLWQGRQDVADALPELVTRLKQQADATLRTLSTAASTELQASNHWHVPSLRQAAQPPASFAPLRSDDGPLSDTHVGAQCSGDDISHTFCAFSVAVCSRAVEVAATDLLRCADSFQFLTAEQGQLLLTACHHPGPRLSRP